MTASTSQPKHKTKQTPADICRGTISWYVALIATRFLHPIFFPLLPLCPSDDTNTVVCFFEPEKWPDRKKICNPLVTSADIASSALWCSTQRLPLAAFPLSPCSWGWLVSAEIIFDPLWSVCVEIVFRQHCPPLSGICLMHLIPFNFMHIYQYYTYDRLCIKV